MHPELFHVPVFVLVALAGAVVGSVTFGGSEKKLVIAAGMLVAMLLAGGVAFSQEWGRRTIPVQGYGTMILIGFLVGVWMAYRRAPLLGVDPKHCMDIGLFGVFAGVAGARVLHILMYWDDFNPLVKGFKDGVLKMFMFWEGGLVFYGAFLVVIPATYLYCRKFSIPAIPFIDMSVASLIAGQAFGRIGCLLNGCCYGKLSQVPWAVEFPPGSPPYAWQLSAGFIEPGAVCSLDVHPTQIYAAVACALTAGFLYAYWPRRRYDGQVLSLMLIMAGAARFFEELLRADEPAAFPGIVSWMTVAHWLALLIVATGVLLMLFFRRRRTLYKFTSAA